MTPGGWVCGDAWFGSVAPAVELKLRYGIYSTFVIKQNLNFYPHRILYDILMLRHPQRPAGHWVVMKANISGVDIFAMVYAWSSKGLTYIISTCGKTIGCFIRSDQTTRTD